VSKKSQLVVLLNDYISFIPFYQGSGWRNPTALSNFGHQKPSLWGKAER